MPSEIFVRSRPRLICGPHQRPFIALGGGVFLYFFERVLHAIAFVNNGWHRPVEAGPYPHPYPQLLLAKASSKALMATSPPRTAWV